MGWKLKLATLDAYPERTESVDGASKVRTTLANQVSCMYALQWFDFCNNIDVPVPADSNSLYLYLMSNSLGHPSDSKKLCQFVCRVVKYRHFLKDRLTSGNHVSVLSTMHWLMDHSGPIVNKIYLILSSFWILCEGKCATPWGEGKGGGRWEGSEWELAIWLLIVLVSLGCDQIIHRSFLHPVVDKFP